MTNDYPNGALKMIDVVSFNKSLKASWIKKYLDSENRLLLCQFYISLYNIISIEQALKSFRRNRDKLSVLSVLSVKT